MYKIGDKIRIIDAKSGARGCNGCIGEITREIGTNGLKGKNGDVYNIKIIDVSNAVYKGYTRLGDTWTIPINGDYQVVSKHDNISLKGRLKLNKNI